MSSNGASAGAELRIICGPTAAGKSAIAMALAERHGLALVCADSRQVYRGFDVGTAKPSPRERERVPHFGIDIADPTERWSAARWAADAEGWITRVSADGALVVGGTGFYLRALIQPLFAAPELDARRRAALGVYLGALPTPELRRWVRALDAARAHLGRAQLVRAAEVALLTGAKLSDLQRDRARPRRFAARWLLVDPGPRLHEHIVARLDTMLAGGWTEEVRALEEHVPAHAPAWLACGYGAVRQLVRGTLGSAAARDAILIATRQYAKRQRTWFRHQLAGERVTTVDPHDPHRDSRIERWWVTGEPE